MFCDLVHSTAFAESHDPEDLRDVIGAFHRCVSKEISRFEGVIARYMGDGAMAYFGYPQAHEDDAERAIRASLASVGEISKLVLIDDYRPKMRIGIATGLVIAGDIVGTGTSPEQDIAGETPNLAARLQAIAEPNEIVISASTRRLIGELFDCIDLGATKLKGFAKPIRAWRVLSESRVSGRFEAMHSSNVAPLVGRDRELAALLTDWHRAKDGNSRTVLLSGEPGIGKSRTLSAFRKRLGAESFAFLYYACSAHYQDSALYPIIHRLEIDADFRRGDFPSIKFEKLQTLVAQGSDDAEDARFIADLLLLESDAHNTEQNQSPEKRKDKILAALLKQVVGLARKQPVLIVFEDVHWADPTSRELLTLIIEHTKSLPVMLIISFRTGFVSPWAAGPQIVNVALDRLARGQSVSMVRRILGRKQLSQELFEQIVERADGIPLFLEEVTKAVVEGGQLRGAASATVSSGSGQSVIVPATLRDSLVARLDRLGAAKQLAQTAAIIGRDFTHELLVALNPSTEMDFDRALETLLESQLVFARGKTPKVTYTFKHALVQDAAYESLLKSQRHQLHSKLANILAVHFPEDARGRPEILAYHYMSCHQHESAAHWLLLAGDAAARNYAHREARKLFEKALDALLRVQDPAKNHRQLIDTIIKLVGVSFAASNPGEHLANLLRAQDLARAQLVLSNDSDEDVVRLTNVQLWLGRTYHYVNQLPEALNYYHKVLNAPILAHGNGLFAVTSVMVGRALGVQGRFGQSSEYLDYGLPILEKKGIWSEFVWGLGFRGLALAASGQYLAGLAKARRALEIATEINYRTGIAASHILLWGVHLQGGDTLGMLDESRTIVTVAEAAGDEMYVYLGYGMLAWAETLVKISILRKRTWGVHKAFVVGWVGEPCSTIGSKA